VEEQGGPTQRQLGWRLAGSGPGAVETGGRLGHNRHTCGPARRNSSFFDLIKVVANRIDLIQIKDGVPEI
jgi:hypothetical protein